MQEGLELARQIDSRLIIARTLCQRGELHFKTSQLNAAFKDFHEALNIGPKESQEVTAEAQFGLAQVEATLSNHNEALLFGQMSLSIFEKIGHKKTSEVRQWLAALPLPDAATGHGDMPIN